MRVIGVAFLSMMAFSTLAEDRLALTALSGDELRSCQKADSAAVLVYREGLRGLVTYAGSRTDLFPKTAFEEPQTLRPEQRDDVRAIWRSYLDYHLALEAVRAFHADYDDLSRAAERDSFLIRHAAFLAEYRTALELISLADTNPAHQTLLNDEIRELGLEAGTWSRLKFRFLNVAIATEFAAADARRRLYRGGNAALLAAIEEDRQAIYDAAKGLGPRLTVKNAGQVLEDLGAKSWLPVQTRVASWAGDTRVHRDGVALITPDLIASIRPSLRPGDLLLQRREWYVSNVGLPGYWTHVALYIGTPDERRALFDEPETKAWVRSQGEPSGDLERLLAKRHHAAWTLSQTREHDNFRRVIEAIGPGVSFTSLEHSAAADSLGVLRPRLSAKDKAIAIVRAFGFAGRPYDYEFDFVSDDKLVCSELVYKAYEPGQETAGLAFELRDVAGHRVMPPNEIVRQWDRDSGNGRRQLDFVLFLDGVERGRTAVRGTEASLRESSNRPKWHILTTMGSN